MSIERRVERLEAAQGEVRVIVVMNPDETAGEARSRYEAETGRTLTGKRVLLVVTGVPRLKRVEALGQKQ
jgi:hypothetical protein